jgi:transmembrane 9 superfamily member 2/4
VLTIRTLPLLLLDLHIYMMQQLCIQFIVLTLHALKLLLFLHDIRDIATYNEAQTLEEAQEESGWKLVHGDVFRPPHFNPMLLAVLAGTGVQVIPLYYTTLVATTVCRYRSSW